MNTNVDRVSWLIRHMNAAESLGELATAARVIKQETELGEEYTKDKGWMNLLRTNYEINKKRIESIATTKEDC